MKRELIAIALVVGATVASGAWAQATAASSTAASEPAVSPDAIQALKKMGAQLQALRQFHVSTEITGERVLVDGQKLQHTASAELDVERPDKIKAVMRSARSTREIVYDGKQVTLMQLGQNYYSTVPFDGTLAALIDAFHTRYGVEFPLSDLFIWGTPNAPVDQFESAMYAGQDYVGSDICDHYAFRQKEADWQIWITTGAKALPRKIVITRRDDDARPQSVSIVEWKTNVTFSDAFFTFHPPAGAKKIELVPVAAKKE
ncbi:DUF2092 domain-containing protein [Pararobbsia silviterrae]|uniref:DUF2092 domain-containing protein n=1 Tax=Pararobbsia silviterrae TaxID=1792498 RepID=A0A494XF56_9BURK|nr:DUF2092 domain-containing protein [Pararobbsia silviterrae]RKP47116.1 DUF2092 domain-containing protein [Pararobbsia silviterrae]